MSSTMAHIALFVVWQISSLVTCDIWYCFLSCGFSGRWSERRPMPSELASDTALTFLSKRSWNAVEPSDDDPGKPRHQSLTVTTSSLSHSPALRGPPARAQSAPALSLQAASWTASSDTRLTRLEKLPAPRTCLSAFISTWCNPIHNHQSTCTLHEEILTSIHHIPQIPPSEFEYLIMRSGDRENVYVQPHIPSELHVRPELASVPFSSPAASMPWTRETPMLTSGMQFSYQHAPPSVDSQTSGQGSRDSYRPDIEQLAFHTQQSQTSTHPFAYAGIEQVSRDWERGIDPTILVPRPGTLNISSYARVTQPKPTTTTNPVSQYQSADVYTLLNVDTPTLSESGGPMDEEEGDRLEAWLGEDGAEEEYEERPRLGTFRPQLSHDVTTHLYRTGFRPNMTPDKLIPFEAPTQHRTYKSLSTTPQQGQHSPPIGAPSLSKRSSEEAAVHPTRVKRSNASLDPSSPSSSASPLSRNDHNGEDAVLDPESRLELKRRKNTLAARRTRIRKAEYVQDLEGRVEELRNSAAHWEQVAMTVQQKCATLEEQNAALRIECAHVRQENAGLREETTALRARLQPTVISW